MAGSTVERQAVTVGVVFRTEGIGRTELDGLQGLTDVDTQGGSGGPERDRE